MWWLWPHFKRLWAAAGTVAAARRPVSLRLVDGELKFHQRNSRSEYTCALPLDSLNFDFRRWTRALSPTFRGRVVAAAPKQWHRINPGFLPRSRRSDSLCRRAPGRWFEGRFFRSETFDARPAVKLWLHRFETTMAASC